MEPMIVTAGSLIAVEMLSLAGLWLRLRALPRWEDARRQLLVEVANAVPPGGTLVQRGPDGGHLAMTMAPALD